MTLKAEKVARFDSVMLEIAVTARDLGAEQERRAIVELIAALHTDIVGGPALKDRIIAAIEGRAA